MKSIYTDQTIKTYEMYSYDRRYRSSPIIKITARNMEEALEIFKIRYQWLFLWKCNRIDPPEY